MPSLQFLQSLSDTPVRRPSIRPSVDPRSRFFRPSLDFSLPPPPSPFILPAAKGRSHRTKEREAEEEIGEEEEVAEEETGVWRAFVVRDVLLARHSSVSFSTCLFFSVLLSLPLPLLPSSFYFFLSFFFLLLLLLLTSFFLRFSMRGLETRLINIAGMVASLFCRVRRAASFYGPLHARCTYVLRVPLSLRHHLLLGLLLLPFPRHVCTFRVENAKYGHQRYAILEKMRKNLNTYTKKKKNFETMNSRY